MNVTGWNSVVWVGTKPGPEEVTGALCSTGCASTVTARVGLRPVGMGHLAGPLMVKSRVLRPSLLT